MCCPHAERCIVGEAAHRGASWRIPYASEFNSAKTKGKNHPPFQHDLLRKTKKSWLTWTRQQADPMGCTIITIPSSSMKQSTAGLSSSDFL